MVGITLILTSPAGGPGHFGQFFCLAQDAIGLFHHLVAKLSEADDPAGAFDQHDIEQSLQFLDARRQSRLGHEAGFRCLAEMAMFFERDEILQLFERG